MKKLGKVMIIIEGDSQIHGPIDLDDNDLLLKLAETNYNNTENVYGQSCPWKSLEGVDQAFEIEAVQCVLEALINHVKKVQLEGVKK